jgi:flagellar protein FlaF
MHAYKDYSPSSSLKSPRDSESEIILSVTRKLKRCAACKKEDFASFASSVHSNRKLWTLLSIDVSHKDNALQSEVKSNILYLGEFVQQYSRKVLKEDLSVRPLIDINLALLRGLGGHAVP